MLTCNRVWVERDDVNTLADGEEITLMRWGNVVVDKVERGADGTVTALEGRFNPTGDFRKTKKLSWVANTPETMTAKLVEFDFLINKEKLEPDDDFRQFLTSNHHPTQAVVRLRARVAVGKRLCLTRTLRAVGGLRRPQPPPPRGGRDGAARAPRLLPMRPAAQRGRAHRAVHGPRREAEGHVRPVHPPCPPVGVCQLVVTRPTSMPCRVWDLRGAAGP